MSTFTNMSHKLSQNGVFGNSNTPFWVCDRFVQKDVQKKCSNTLYCDKKSYIGRL